MTDHNSQKPESTTGKAASKARPWTWVPTLYLAEGLPYVLVNVVSTIMYTRLGASLSAIGFWTSLLGFAWVIKPLWGPLVDLYWTKRRWAVLMQILMGVLLGLLRFRCRARGGGLAVCWRWPQWRYSPRPMTSLPMASIWMPLMKSSRHSLWEFAPRFTAWQ